MDKLKIEDCPSFIKDTNSKAILNTNVTEIIEYRSKKNMLNDVEKLKVEISSVKSELSDIKSILTDIFNTINK